MLLRELVIFAATLPVWPPLYSLQNMRYVLVLDLTGQPELELYDTANERWQLGQQRVVPNINRSTEQQPYLFADNFSYTFGLIPGHVGLTEQRRLAGLHKGYLELIDQCYKQTKHPKVKAVLDFYAAGGVDLLKLPANFDYGQKITIQVAGEFLVDLPAVQQFWASLFDIGDRREMTCLVCGCKSKIRTKVLEKIRGLPQGHESGTVLFTANGEAFQSYGLKGTQNNAVCDSCNSGITRAINHLLLERDHHLKLKNNGIAFIYWSANQSESADLLSWLDTAGDLNMSSLYHALHKGERVALPQGQFYLLELAAAGSRAFIKSWHQQKNSSIFTNIDRWFKAQSLQQPDGQPYRPVGIDNLLLHSYKQGRSGGIDPNLHTDLIKTALLATPVPLRILADLLPACFYPEQGVEVCAYERMVLLKLILCSQRNAPQLSLEQVCPDLHNVGYLSGRLLASSVPKEEGQLLRTYANQTMHNPAVGFGHLKQRETATFKLPTMLSLIDQGWFVLGFYHQRVADMLTALADH